MALLKTKSKSVSNVKLAVVTLALAVVGGAAAFVLAPGTPGAPPNVLLPMADGFYRSWTSINPAVGIPRNISRYTTVDESTCNGDVDYVTVSSTASRVSFIVSTSTIPVGSTINSISVFPCAEQSGANRNTQGVLNVFARVNGVNSADSGNYQLSRQYQSFAPSTFNYNFITTATTSIEIGAVLTSIPSQSAGRLSQIYAQIDYTPGPPVAPISRYVYQGSYNEAQIGWLDMSDNEEGFIVYRTNANFPAGTGVFSEIGRVGPNATQFNDRNIPNGGTYYYNVKSFNKYGNSVGVSYRQGVNVVPPAGSIIGTCNTRLTVSPSPIRSGLYDLNLSDSEGTSAMIIVSSGNNVITGGHPSCLQSIPMTSISISTADFPIRVLTQDCSSPANQCVISYP
jgi:hypothetical protein